MVDAYAKKNYGSNYNINNDDSAVTLNIWPNGVGAEAYSASTGNVENIKSWSKRVYSMRELSPDLIKKMADAGYKGMSVIINVLNDENTDNILLTVKNGQVMYNWVESDEALSNDPKNITVYITDTGKKYHNADCRTLDDSQYPISLEDAINAGYGPCGVCGPPRR